MFIVYQTTRLLHLPKAATFSVHCAKRWNKAPRRSHNWAACPSRLRSRAISNMTSHSPGHNNIGAYTILVNHIQCIISVNTINKDRKIWKQLGYHKISVLEQWINNKEMEITRQSPHCIKFHLAHANGSVRNHLVELGPVEWFRAAQHSWFGR